MIGPTPKQAELLRFIEDHIAEHGYAPSYAEMMAAVGLAGKSGVHRMIEGLRQRGWIRRIPNHSRAIEVLSPAPRPGAPVPPPPSVTPSGDVIYLPLHGRIA